MKTVVLPQGSTLSLRPVDLADVEALQRRFAQETQSTLDPRRAKALLQQLVFSDRFVLRADDLRPLQMQPQVSHELKAPVVRTPRPRSQSLSDIPEMPVGLAFELDLHEPDKHSDHGLLTPSPSTSPTGRYSPRVETSRQLALLTGDFMIKDTPLEGGSSTEMSGLMWATLQKLGSPEIPCGNLSETGKHALPKLTEVFAGLVAGQESLDARLKGVEDSREHADKILTAVRDQAQSYAERIQHLKPGESLLLPGGWSGSPGHALVYQVQRESGTEPPTFSFTLYNTGDGLNTFHASAPTRSGNKVKYDAKVTHTGITLESVTDLTTLRALVELDTLPRFPRAFPHARYDSTAVYTAILPRLGGQPGPPETHLDDYITAQRSGTCAWKSLMAVLRTALPKDDYKRVAFAIKVNALLTFAETSGSTLGSRDTDRILVGETLRNLERTANKLRQAGVLSDRDLLRFEKDTQTLRQHLDEIERGRNAPRSHAAGKATPAPTWDGLVAKTTAPTVNPKNLEAKLIGVRQPKPLSVTDVVVPAIHPPSTVEQTGELLHGVRDACNALLEAGQTDRILPLVSELFRALPPPGHALWDQIPREQTNAVLDALVGLQEIYVAGAAEQRDGTAERVVVTHVALAITDQVTRRALGDAYAPYHLQCPLRTLEHLHGPSFRVDSSGAELLRAAVSYFEKLGVRSETSPILKLQSLDGQLTFDPPTRGTPGACNEGDLLLGFLKEEAVRSAVDELLGAQKQPLTDLNRTALLYGDLGDQGGPLGERFRAFGLLHRMAILARSSSIDDVQRFKPRRRPQKPVAPKTPTLTPTFGADRVRFALDPSGGLDLFQNEPTRDDLIRFGVNDFRSIIGERGGSWRNENETVRLPSLPALSSHEALDLRMQQVHPTLRVRMALSHYLDDVSLLSDPDHQTYLRWALLGNALFYDTAEGGKTKTTHGERGLLQQALQKDPDGFGAQVTQLIQSGLVTHDKCGDDLRATLFLTKLALDIRAEYRTAGIEPPQDLPDPVVILRELRGRKRSSSPSPQRKLTVPEGAALDVVLAAALAAREPLTFDDISDIVCANVRLRCFGVAPELADPEIEARARRALVRCEPALRKLGDGERQKLLGTMLAAAGGPKDAMEGWTSTTPIASNKRFAINLLTAEVFVDQRPIGDSLPRPARETDTYRRVLGDRYLPTTSDGRCYLLSGGHYRIGLSGVAQQPEVQIQERHKDLGMIQFVPHERLPVDLPRPLRTEYSHWITVGGEKAKESEGPREPKLYLLDGKGNPAYVGTPDKSGHLVLTRCGDKDPPLTLLPLANSPAATEGFVDAGAQVAWSRGGQIQTLEMPTFGLTFERNTEGELAWSGDPRYLLSRDKGDLLPGFQGYLRLDGPQGGLALIPRGRPHVGAPTHDDPLKTSVTVIPEARGKVPEGGLPSERGLYGYIECRVGTDGRLESPRVEDNLHLAGLALATRNYRDALEYLTRARSEAPLSTESYRAVRDLLELLDQNHDNHPNAAAVRLQAVSLLLDNAQGVEPPEMRKMFATDDPATSLLGKVRAQLEAYVNSAGNVDVDYRLTPDQERSLLMYLADHEAASKSLRLYAEVAFPKESLLLHSQRELEVTHDLSAMTEGETPAPPTYRQWCALFDKRAPEKALVPTPTPTLAWRTLPLTHPGPGFSDNFWEMVDVALGSDGDRKKELGDRLTAMVPDTTDIGKLNHALRAYLLLALQDPEPVRSAFTQSGLDAGKTIAEQLHRALGSARESVRRLIAPPKFSTSQVSPYVEPEQALNEILLGTHDRGVLLSVSAKTPQPIRLDLSKLLRKVPYAPLQELLSFVVDSRGTRLDQGDPELKPRTDRPLPKLRSGTVDPVVTEEVGSLQKNLSAYWQRQEPRLTVQPKQLGELRTRLAQVTALREQLDQARNDLLQLANFDPDPTRAAAQRLRHHGRAGNQLTLDALEIAFLQGNHQMLEDRNPSLKGDGARRSRILEGTMSCLLLQSRIEQAERAMELVGRIDSLSESPERTELLTELADVLSARRCYDPRQNPEYLVFEAHAEPRGLLLRLEQVQILDSLQGNSTDYPQAIQQLRMGAGKTKVLLPLLALKKATGKNLSLVMVPRALLHTNQTDLRSTSHAVFRQSCHSLDFSRGSDDSVGRLAAIRDTLQRAVRDREYIVTTPESVQSLELKYQEDLYRLAHGGLDGSARTELMSKADLLRSILSELGRRGAVHMDEVDLALNTRFEVNFTIGKSKPIPAPRARLVLDIYRLLATDPELKSKINLQHSTQPPLHGVMSYPVLRDALATKLLSRPPLNERLGKDRDAFLAYVTGASAKPPEALDRLYEDESTRETAQLLVLMREQLCTLLPMTLGKNPGEHFGRSRTSGAPYAIPYNRSQPNERAQFGNHYETLNYTLQMYLHQSGGVTTEQVKRLVQQLRSEMLEHVQRTGDKPESTEAARLFQQLLPDGQKDKVDLSHARPDDPALLQAIRDEISRSPERTLDFIETFVVPEITLYESKLNSDAQDLVGMFHTVQGFSGTTWNHSTFHQSLKHSGSDETDGLVTDITLNPQKTQVRQVRATAPGATLAELDTAGRLQGSTAFIDAGAVFKGRPNAAVADEMSRYFKAHAGLNIKAVVFYDDDSGQLALMHVDTGKTDLLGGTDPAVLERTGIAPEHRFTYYDQAHTTGSDIRQAKTARGLVTIGAQTFVRDLQQAQLRMRELHGGQTCDILVPEEIARDVQGSGSGRLDAEAVLRFVVENQAQRLGDDKVRSVRQKMKNAVKHRVLAQIQREPSVERQARLFQMLEPLIVERTEDDPYLQCRSSEKRPTEEVLQGYQMSLLRQIGQVALSLDPKHQVGGPTRHNLEQGIQYLRWESAGPLSEAIAAFLRASPVAMDRDLTSALTQLANDVARPSFGGELRANTGSLPPSTLTTSSQGLGTEQQRQTEKQQEQEQELSLQREQVSYDGTNPAPIHPWSEKNPLARPFYAAIPELLKEPNLQRTAPLMVSLRSLHDPPIFDEELLGTENYLRTIQEGGFNLLDDYQKPVYHLLAVQREGKWHVVLLSLEDATALQAKLQTETAVGQRVCLCDGSGRLIQGGTPRIVQSELDGADDFQRLLAQVKLINKKARGTVTFTPRQAQAYQHWMTSGPSEVVRERARLDTQFTRSLIKKPPVITSGSPPPHRPPAEPSGEPPTPPLRRPELSAVWSKRLLGGNQVYPTLGNEKVLGGITISPTQLADWQQAIQRFIKEGKPLEPPLSTLYGDAMAQATHRYGGEDKERLRAAAIGMMLDQIGDHLSYQIAALEPDPMERELFVDHFSFSEPKLRRTHDGFTGYIDNAKPALMAAQITHLLLIEWHRFAKAL